MAAAAGTYKEQDVSLLFPREPLRGLDLRWNKDKQAYDLVFGYISGDLYSQLNTRVALLVYSGKYTREEVIGSFVRNGTKIPEVEEIYQWYHNEGKKAWRFDPFKWVRLLIISFVDWKKIPISRLKFLTIKTRRTIRDFPILGFGIHKLEDLE